MTAIAFDTHAFIKRLTAAGMPESQAEILAEEQTRLIETQLATKADLEMLKHELTIRVGAMIIALGGFLSALKFFGH
jgi:hypothetical protein